jgi:hypothetical protein
MRGVTWFWRPAVEKCAGGGIQKALQVQHGIHHHVVVVWVGYDVCQMALK